MDYYKKLINDIESAIDKNRAEDALKLIEDELNMPFIPRDIEEKLNEYLITVKSLLEDNSTLNDEMIEKYLHDTKEHQLLAVDQLNNCNLRNYIYMVKEYLESDGFINAKMLLIDSLVQQQINFLFRVNKDNEIIEFNPASLKPVYESEEYAFGKKLLEDEFMKEPSRLYLGMKVLNQSMMMSYPYTFSKQQMISEVKEIIETINKAFDSAI